MAYVFVGHLFRDKSKTDQLTNCVHALYDCDRFWLRGTVCKYGKPVFLLYECTVIFLQGFTIADPFDVKVQDILEIDHKEIAFPRQQFLISFLVH